MTKMTEHDVSQIQNPYEGEVTRNNPAIFERLRVKLQAEQLLLGMVESTKRAEAKRLIQILKS